MTISPGAYYGHAAPTWDTVTGQRIIDATNAHIANGAIHGGGAFAPDTTVHWLDVDNGNGTATIQTLSTGGAAGQTLNVAGSVWSDTAGGFNASTDLYTAPQSGVYFCRAQMRVADSFSTACNICFGISQGANDIGGSWVMWNKYTTGGGSRFSVDSTRIFGCPAGGTIRAYAWQDSGTNLAVTAAALQVWRIGP